MSEEKVSLLVQYVVSGQEQMKQINSDLDKLASKSDVATKSTSKSELATSKNNLTLGKQIPVLREIQPLLGAAGLGWVTGASAIAALGIGAMQADQAFNTWMSGMLGLNMVTNTLAGGTSGLGKTIGDAASNSNKLGISMNQYSSAMSGLESVIHDPVTSLQILNDAVSISHATGQPLDQVVKALSDAFTNGAWSNGAFVQPGITALQTVETQLKSTGDTNQGLKTTVNDAWGQITNTISTATGSWVSDVGTSLKKIALNFGPEGDPLISLVGFSKAISSSAIWDGLGTGWSTSWQATWGYIKGDWDRMTSYLGSIDWGKLWDGMGAIWSQIWRGAINVAILQPLNGLISLLDLIHFDIPSWVPLLGGKSFGINIPQVPLLANGGDIAQAGAAVVGDNGPELLNLPQGASVTPLSGDSGGSAGNQTINLYLADGTMLASWFINELDNQVRLRGGH